eukprot:CAMPEP_0198303810 /NCGR_PEP_ID=MMETSP1449-20131203/57076_1 /TAXON_ID=420275 /ORGANISM="Attheya septentrionalis, Strain CCMP2084" /LENGTH=149 /DNA_ID=CAMNT_0044006317 /DNA_START=344 /DNA_END=793 /DNA_ORIENTATION=-
MYFKAYNSCIISAPIEDVWKTVRDFSTFHVWHPSFKVGTIRNGDPSDRVGCVRDLVAGDGGVFVEQLYELSDKEDTFVYKILESPLPMADYYGRIKLTKITDVNQTFFEWMAEAKVENQEHFDIITKVANDVVYQPGMKALQEKFAGDE